MATADVPSNPDAPSSWRHRRGLLPLGPRPRVMAILNVTPDSFSDGGRFAGADDAIAEALACVERGADIIDVGGESTRPGAEPVSVEEELGRVVPVIAGIRRRSDVVVSVDTTKVAVAREALDAGADIVNDISGFLFEPAMAALVAERGAGCVLMHTPGRPTEMGQLADYEDVVTEVAAALRARLDAALSAGVTREAIVLDPGFGFGKTAEHNYVLLAGLGALMRLGRPLLAGVSRKRMIRAAVGTDPVAVEHGTTAANVAAILAGARIIRVHDVEAGRAAAEVARDILRAEDRRA